MQPTRMLAPTVVTLAAAACGYVANAPSTPVEFRGQTVTAVVVVKFLDRICGARPDDTVLCIDSPPSIADSRSIYAPQGPTTTTLPAPVVRLASGGWGVCALLRDASVWCWGETGSPNDPVEVAAGVVDLTMASGGLLCTRSIAGSITCTGNAGTPFQSDSHPGLGRDGLGPGSIDLGGRQPAAISLGESKLDVVLDDGTIATWDLNDLTAPRTQVVGVTDAIALSAGTGWIGGGGEHACAVLGDGTARCWGANDAGQLGAGSTSDASAAALAVAGLADVAQVAAGSSHTCARLVDGTVVCWGASAEFAGTKNQSSEGWYSPIPVRVPDVSNAVDVSTGTVVNCALAPPATLVCWGGCHYQG